CSIGDCKHDWPDVARLDVARPDGNTLSETFEYLKEARQDGILRGNSRKNDKAGGGPAFLYGSLPAGRVTVENEQRRRLISLDDASAVHAIDRFPQPARNRKKQALRICMLRAQPVIAVDGHLRYALPVGDENVISAIDTTGIR